MTFRRWDEIPEHERETEATIRRRWAGYRERDPSAPWIAQFDALLDDALAAYRERLAPGTCEAAVAAHRATLPYMPCGQLARGGSPYCANHQRAERNWRALQPKAVPGIALTRCRSGNGLGFVRADSGTTV